MTSKTMKLLKECDCCQKKSGPLAQCSALFALKAMARGAGSTAPSVLGTDQQESEFCILHRSPLRSGQSDCIWDQPIVLHETVSPHLCLAVFFCPGVNKGLSPSPWVHSKITQWDLVSGLRVKVTSSRQQFQCTPWSHKEKQLWNDQVRIPFQKRIP